MYIVVAEMFVRWQHTCAHFSKKLVHYRAISSYTFAPILFPGKRYNCAHCILLAAQLSVLGQATDLLNDEWLTMYVIENYVIYRVLHRVNDNCYFAHSFIQS